MAGSQSTNSSRSRIERLRLCFSGLGVDAYLVSHLPNILYLCGFTGSAALLLVEADRATLVTDPRYTFQACEEVSGAKIGITKKSLIEGIAGDLRKRRGRFRVAFEGAHLTCAQKAALEVQVGSRVRWAPGDNNVEKLRAIKDESEIATIREVAELISRVYQENLGLIQAGRSELEVAARMESAMKEKGAAGPSFETIVASGPRSAWAHAHPSAKPLGKNELVVLDQGAILRGYCSDMTRTVFLGRASAKVRGLYNAVLEAQSAAKRAVRPGVAAGDVDAAARGVLRGRKLARYFTHSTGHGLGLEVHEMPRLGRGEKTPLEAGMVVTIEPGVYLEGVGGIRIEDDVLVSAGGAVDLTTAPRDFLDL